MIKNVDPGQVCDRPECLQNKGGRARKWMLHGAILSFQTSHETTEISPFMFSSFKIQIQSDLCSDREQQKK